MHKRTTIDFQMISLDDHTVTLYDNEWYSEFHLQFESLAKAEQCYEDTVAILTEAHNKLAEKGWSQAQDWGFHAPEEV